MVLPSIDFLPDEPGMPLHDALRIHCSIYGSIFVLILAKNIVDSVDMMYQRNCVEIPVAVHFGAGLLASKRVEITKIRI